MSGDLINQHELYDKGVDGKPVLRTSDIPLATPPEIPTEIFLSNNEVSQGLPAGTVVGTLTVDAGVPPVIFTVIQDDSAAFEIIGNELRTTRTLNFATEPQLNVGILAQDANTNSVEQTFLIEVLEGLPFEDVTSLELLNANSAHGRGPATFGGTENNWGLALWVRGFTAAPNTETVWSRYDSNVNTTRGIAIRKNNQKVEVEIRNGNGTLYKLYVSDKDVFDGTWNHIFVTFLGSTLRIYINGVWDELVNKVQDDSFNSSDFPNGVDWCFGNELNNGASIRFAAVRMDEVTLWDNSNITAQEVAAVYNGGVPTDNMLVIPDVPDCYWRTEISSGTLLRNVAGAGGDTLLNAVALINASESDFVDDTPANPAYFPIRSIFFNNLEYLTRPTTNPSFSTTIKFTLSIWVKRQTNNVMTICSNRNVGDEGFKMWLDGGGKILIEWRQSAGRAFRVRCDDVLNSNSWYHVVLAYNGITESNAMELYLNANECVLQEEQDNVTQDIVSVDNFVIGANGDFLNDLWRGYLKDLAIWDGYGNVSDTNKIYAGGEVVDVRKLDLSASIGALAIYPTLGDNVKNNVTLQEDLVDGNDDFVMVNMDDSNLVQDLP